MTTEADGQNVSCFPAQRPQCRTPSENKVLPMTACTPHQPGSIQPVPQAGFQTWIAAPVRARSPEVDYGCWWTLKDPIDFPRWRVSLLVSTGEVYALQLEGQ